MSFGAGSAPADEQPWTAQWCWTAPRLSRPWNTYAYFRRVVDLPDRPTSAVVRISADARYTLLVNGRRVHQGPARSFPHAQSFDTLDLADFLTAGVNAVCAIVHQFGVPTGQSVYRDATGFLLDGVVETPGGAVQLHTPDGWLARDAAGWRKHVARLSADLGFQEHFDADADPPDWLAPEFDATEAGGWRAPVVITPVNGHPWLAMRPRRAPLLTDEVEPFAAALAHFAGENARGYKVAEDVFAPVRQETRRKTKSPFENPDTLLRDDDASATLPPPPDGQFHMAVLDLGRVRTAHVIIEIEEAAGDEIIDVLYLNEVDKNFAPVFHDDATTALADRYRCRPGVQRWEPFWPKGFRYAAVIFRNVEKLLKIRHLAVRTVHAAVEQLGQFESSDERLNAIYAVGVHTLRACALDAYIDCPDAGQTQRWTHARTHGRAAAYAFGDAALLRRGIVQLAESQAADGSLHAHPPSDDPRGRDAAVVQAWVETLWEHYQLTGEGDLLLECRPTLDRALEFLSRGEHSTAPGALAHLRTLRRASAIYDLLRADTERTRATQLADALAITADARFWDAKANAWRDTFDAGANAPAADPTSVHTNALALLLGLRPEARAAVARDVILRSMTARRGKVAIPSPAQAADTLDALIEAGVRAETLDLIRTRWGAMLDGGATTLWESWDGATGSKCLGAAAAPVYVISQQVLGVAPAEPGWRRVRVAPLVGTLDFARGAVPCPRGLIRVEWEKAGEDQLVVRVELPEGVGGAFIGPLGETRQLDSGATEFHT